MPRFSKDGRLIIPLQEREERLKDKKEIVNKVRFRIVEAYCPNGCNIIDQDTMINGFPGLHIKFKRSGMEGEFVVSAIEGDFDKVILNGELVNGVKDDLYCPYCGVMFEKLVDCNCSPGAEMVVVGLTPKLNFNEAITFCNVTGCSNGTFIQAGEILRHVRLSSL